jgi:hypothetical protein
MYPPPVSACGSLGAVRRPGREERRRRARCAGGGPQRRCRQDAGPRCARRGERCGATVGRLVGRSSRQRSPRPGPLRAHGRRKPAERFPNENTPRGKCSSATPTDYWPLPELTGISGIRQSTPVSATINAKKEGEMVAVPPLAEESGPGRDAEWVAQLKRRNGNALASSAVLFVLLGFGVFLISQRSDAGRLPVAWFFFASVLVVASIALWAWWQSMPSMSRRLYQGNGGTGLFVAAGVVVNGSSASWRELDGFLMAKEGTRLVLRRRTDMAVIRHFDLEHLVVESSPISHFGGFGVRIGDEASSSILMTRRRYMPQVHKLLTPGPTD